MPLTRLVTALLAPAVLSAPLLVAGSPPAVAEGGPERDRRTSARAAATTVLPAGEAHVRHAGHLGGPADRDLLRLQVTDRRLVEAEVLDPVVGAAAPGPDLRLLRADGRELAGGDGGTLRTVVPRAGTHYLVVAATPTSGPGDYDVTVDLERYQAPRLVGDLERARVGREYHDVLRVRYGEPQISLTQQGGRLPPGLWASRPGPRRLVVRGVPQRTGRWSLTLEARDGLGHRAVREFRVPVRR